MKRLNFFGFQVHEVDIQGQDLQTVADHTNSQDINILFFPINENISLKGLIIKWGIFETDILPAFYIDYLSNSQLIWVPSQWAQQILINHSIAKEKIEKITKSLLANTVIEEYSIEIS